MISIIVPVYNVEKVIGRCIDSIRRQTYQDWELILVDDGSCDNSGKECDSYALMDERIHVAHQSNQGPSAARNVGINCAKGNYFCFIDSDDYVESHYLEDFSLNSNYDLVVQGMKLTFTNGRPDELNKPEKSLICNIKEALAEETLFNLLCGPCCKAFKTDIVRQLNLCFPLNVRYGEDRIFVLKYLQSCKGRVFLNPVSNYVYTHENVGSLTSRRKKSVELYQSSILQYRELKKLNEELEWLPQVFISKYRDEIALDTYQAVFNNLVENKRAPWNSVFFFNLLDKELLEFISASKHLPRTFKLIKSLLKIVRTSCLFKTRHF